MAQLPQLNDSQNNLLAKIADNTGESKPKVGDGQHNLLFKIAQNTYAGAGLLATSLQQSGSGYVLVQQGDDLAAKYAEAKTKNPSATNRISVFIVPGTYSLSSELEIDAEYVDLVGLGAQFQSPAVIVSNNTLNVTANDVRVSGISVGTQAFKISDNKPLQIFENCIGTGDESFGFVGFNISGTFINCIAGNLGFANSGTASGTFVNCFALDDSFGAGGGGVASGEFQNCESGSGSFGLTCSGIFYNCKGGSGSFGGNSGDGGTISGELIFCRKTGAGANYETPSGSGIIRFCLDGDNNIVNADAP